MEFKERFVGEFAAILVKLNIVTQPESDALQNSFKDAEQENFDDFLVEEGLVEESDLLRALSQYYKVPSFDVNGYFFSNFELRKFPKDFLLRNNIIPVEVDENMLLVVASRPEEPGLEAAIGKYVSYDINFYVGIARDIQDAVKEYYDKSPALDADIEDETLDDEMRLEKEALNRENEVEEIEELSYGDIVYKDDQDEEL